MVEETPYFRRTRPQAGAAMPRVSAESYGAGFARDVGQAVGDLHQRNLQGYRLERQRTADSEWARFQHSFAEARDELDQAVRDARKDPVDGHAERVRQIVEDRREGLLADITEDTVRQRATAQFEDWGGRVHSAEGDFEEVKRSEGVVRDYAATRKISANRIRRLDNADDYLTEFELGRQNIAGLNLADDVKDKLGQEWEQVAGVSFLRGVIDREPALAKAMLDGDGLFDHLDPDTVEQLRNSADVEIRRQAAAEEHRANLELADFREQVRVAKSEASQGIDNSEQLPAMIEQARQLGLEDVAVDLEGVAYDGQFAKIYEAAPPVQREQRVAALQAKGDARNRAEDRELAWLMDKQGALDGRFNSDPAGFYVRTSTPPPALDFADPASVAARARWARSASPSAGRPIPPLTKNEAALINAQWDSGSTAAQRQVLDQLAQFPADQAAAAARMVDGEDPQLAVMATLPQAVRNLALRGRDALKANGKLLSQALTDDPELGDRIAGFDGRLTQALRGVPPAQRDAVLQTARQIAAGAIDQSGGGLTANTYWKSLNAALGARGEGAAQTGGLGRWGETWFPLPDGVSGAAFGAAVQAAAQNADDHPVNPDNSRATLARAYPVAIGGGVYEFRTANGAPVKSSKGTAWRVRVRPAGGAR